MPAPYHSIFTGWMLFLTLNEQCQSTEGKAKPVKNGKTGGVGTPKLLN